MKEITIKMHLAFAEEDDLPDERGEPSQRVVDEASKKLRMWLHNQGIEGDLSIVVEEDDRHVALLRVMQPDDWIDEDVKAFCGRVSEYIRGLLSSDWPEQFVD